MSYIIDSGIWGSVFAVPSVVVDEHIKMCSPLSLKILLVMLRHSGAPVDAKWLSERLNISPADISDALGYWVGAGVVQDSERPVERVASAAVLTASPPAETAPPADEPELSAERVITLPPRAKIGPDKIAALSKTDSTITQLLTEAQSVMGAPLNPVESESLVALCSYYGMRSDAVLMLLQYCVLIGHKSMSYVEKTAAAWLEKGISSHEQIEAEILRLMQSNENEKKIIKAFGLYNRGMTPREREFVAAWFALGLDERLIFLACERAAENTGKVSFAYADKILASWKAKGISTVKAAIDELTNGRPAAAPPPQNKSARTGGDSSLDMDKIHEMLHRGYK